MPITLVYTSFILKSIFLNLNTNVKQSLEFIEFMLLRSCNLSCKGCTTFSDLKHPGEISEWNDIKNDLLAWSDRIEFEAMGFMGGEPLIHPRIKDWIVGIRETFPNTQLRFITNGLLLEKHKDVIDLLHSIGNCVIKISKHIDDPRIKSVIKYIMNRFDWEPVTEFGINRWSTGNEVKFQITVPQKFYKTFKGEYANMAPHNNNPVDAFNQLCVQKRCPLMYEGKLYKCCTAGLLEHILHKFNYPNYEQWKPYLNTGISPDCDQKTLNAFINNFAKPHRMCSQCPTLADTDSIIDHKTTVQYKNDHSLL